MGDHWPWEARELYPRVPFNESAFPQHKTGIWLLKTSIIGNYCISRQGKTFSTSVGDLTCQGQKFYNDTAQETQWRGTPNHTEPQPHPLTNFSNLKEAWNNLTADIDWQAPRGLYWICGRQAYMVLPRSWFGSCVLGSIRPSFFLLLLRQGENPGVPIYDQRLNRKKQGNLQIGLGRMTNGPLSESSSTMVLPPGQRMGLGATIPPYICSTASSGCRLLLKL
jgi:hypothetical protein